MYGLGAGLGEGACEKLVGNPPEIIFYVLFSFEVGGGSEASQAGAGFPYIPTEPGAGKSNQEELGGNSVGDNIKRIPKMTGKARGRPVNG